MGIDVYAKEIHESAERKAAQLKFEQAVAARDKLPPGSKRDKAQERVMDAYSEMYRYGYLRESYHGGPYVCPFLVKEAWNQNRRIPSAKLRERLPDAVLLAVYRDHVVYGEAESNPGEIALDAEVSLASVMAKLRDAMKAATNTTEADAILAKIAPEQREQIIKRLADGIVPTCAIQFVEFVEQCEAYEAKHGKPPIIHVSA
jgi:excinuclease UvrABC nuclease subunit